MAVLKTKGQLKVGDRFMGVSIIGTKFHCSIEAEVKVGEFDGIVPIDFLNVIRGHNEHDSPMVDMIPDYGGSLENSMRFGMRVRSMRRGSPTSRRRVTPSPRASSTWSG
jgi:hypothetical protein